MANRTKQSDKASASAPAVRRDSLVKLRAHVDDIEKRLKQANRLTKSSVKALTTAFERLHTDERSDKNTQRLAQYIDELAGQLNGLIEQTRLDVAHDLKMVMADPRMETVSAALTKANQRLTRAEAQQADAIGAINGQIAKLAKAMDNRLQREVRAREASIAALDSKFVSAQEALETDVKITMETTAELGARIEAVETLSADAVKTIGDKVVSVTEELQQQTQSLKNDVGEQGLDLQKGYEEHKEKIARRIESLEDDQRNTIPSLERRLVTLATRIEVLETYEPVQQEQVQIESVQETALAPPPYAVTEQSAGETNIEAAPSIAPSAPFGVSDSAVQLDAFSPSEAVVLTSVTPPQNPYAMQDGVVDLGASTGTDTGTGIGNTQAAEYVPQEYVPEEYVPETYASETYTPEVYAPEVYVAEVSADANAYPAEYSAPTHASFNVETGAFEQTNAPTEFVPTPAPTLASGPLQTPDLAPPPFANGMPPMQSIPMQNIDAQAQSMFEARPGAEPEKQSRFKRTKAAKKPKKAKSEKSTSGSGGGIPAPLRVGGLMLGVAVVGLFAAKTVLPKLIGTQATPTAQIKSSTATETISVASQPPLNSVETVGDYSQTMQAPDLGVGVDGKVSAQKLSLEAAAIKGEPIAQFQLGLSHLEAGRNAQAIRLIRLAADQGQPAAQYRLGKLYEAGVGVKVDLPVAMGLLEKSAASGNRIAMHDLGHYHATGAASTPNIETAVSWFTKAAERGVLDSQFNLGVLYQGDSGIERDVVSSYVWFEIAGAQGDKVAAQRGALMARDLTTEQLSQGKTRIAAFAPTRINDAANGVFRDLPWAMKAVAAKTNVDVSVQGAQTMLSKLGYDVGTPDGAMGPRTRNAVISFERANGLPETGRVNASLVERLTLASGA